MNGIKGMEEGGAARREGIGGKGMKLESCRNGCEATAGPAKAKS
jgi:hypothetical protein